MLVYGYYTKFYLHSLCSQAWRRRRGGLKLRNHHSAQATADVISETKDVGDVPETKHQDQRKSDEDDSLELFDLGEEEEKEDSIRIDSNDEENVNPNVANHYNFMIQPRRAEACLCY